MGSVFFEVIFEFVFGLRGVVLDAQFEFALLGAEHDRLALHPAHHVEGRDGSAPQGHLQHVLADALLEGLAQLVLDLEEAVGRTEPAEPLVGPLVVVVLDPEPDPRPGRLEVLELGPPEELPPDAPPEALDLAEGHGVLRTRADVGDPVFLHFLLEAARPPPGGILPPVVGEHFLGHAVFAGGPPVDLDDGLRGLAAEDLRPHDIARVVVEISDEVGVLSSQPEGEDVALPHLVGTRPLEATGLGRVARRLGRLRLDEFLPVQGPPDGFRARLHQEEPAQHLRDAQGAPPAVLLLEFHDLLAHRRLEPPRGARPRNSAFATLRLRFAEQARLGTLFPVRTDPVAQRRGSNAQLPGHLRLGVALLLGHQHRPQPELRRIAAAPA